MNSRSKQDRPPKNRRLGAILRDQRGSISAEFALVLPAVGAVVVLCVAAIALSAQHIRVTAVAHQIARIEARGEPLQQGVLNTLGYPVTVERSRQGEAHCVQLVAQPGRGPLAAIQLRAKACALNSGT